LTHTHFMKHLLGIPNGCMEQYGEDLRTEKSEAILGFIKKHVEVPTMIVTNCQ
jgi:hypothetical protein